MLIVRILVILLFSVVYFFKKGDIQHSAIKVYNRGKTGGLKGWGIGG